MRGKRDVKELFLWTAGVEPDNLALRRDRARYNCGGAAVWLTALAAAVSAYVGLRLAVCVAPLAAAGALLFALFIFTIDRLLVIGSRSRRVPPSARATVWVVRSALAALLALAIADPLVLQLFSTEIDEQLPIDQANARMAYLNAPPDPVQVAHIQALLDQWHQDQTASQAARESARIWSAAAQCERAGQIDCGPGIPPGTGRPGVGTEANDRQTKADGYQQAAGTAQRTEDDAYRAYAAARDQLATYISNRNQTVASIGAATGYFARRDALDSYIAAHPGLGIVRWVLVALLVLVNMSVVLLVGLFRDSRELPAPQ